MVPCGIKCGQDHVCIHAEQSYSGWQESAKQGSQLEHVEKGSYGGFVETFQGKVVCRGASLRSSGRPALFVLKIIALSLSASSILKISKPLLGCLRPYVHEDMAAELSRGLGDRNLALQGCLCLLFPPNFPKPGFQIAGIWKLPHEAQSHF